MQHVKEKVENILLNFVRISDKNNTYNEKKRKPDQNLLIERTNSKSEFSTLLKRRLDHEHEHEHEHEHGTNINLNLYLKMFIHELRTPISTISMGLELIENTNPTEENAQIIDDMKKSVLFLEEIFSKFAVIQNGNITLNPFTVFSLKRLLRRLESYLHHQLLDANAQFTYEIHDSVYVWNYGDKHNLLHCAINLLKNAFKYRNLERGSVIRIVVTRYMPSAPVLLVETSPSLENEIKFSKKGRMMSIFSNPAAPTAPVAPTAPAPSLCRRPSVMGRLLHKGNTSNSPSSMQPDEDVKDQQIVQICVYDNNDHILPHIKQRLFESYNTTSGSGLGLYICKNIIELHGGEISHTFIEPVGNVFKIRLPLKTCVIKEMQSNAESDEVADALSGAPGESDEVADALSGAPGVPASDYNVLIVDDSMLNRKMACQLLKSRSYFKKVRTSDSGADAIDRVKIDVNHYDIILIDKNMPDTDGLTTVLKLRGLKYKKLIIGLTGEHDKVNDRLFLENGADYVLTKPLDNMKIGLLIEFVKKYPPKHMIDKNMQLVEGQLDWV